jgi:hypothetical protein
MRLHQSFSLGTSGRRNAGSDTVPRASSPSVRGGTPVKGGSRCRGRSALLAAQIFSLGTVIGDLPREEPSKEFSPWTEFFIIKPFLPREDRCEKNPVLRSKCCSFWNSFIKRF